MITDAEWLAYADSNARKYPLEALSPARKILEIGAGIGNGTLQMMAFWPESYVTALEPDDTARAVLTWRLRDEPTRDNVTILPFTIEEATCLEDFDAVVMHHVICQVPVSERPIFWDSIRARLKHGAAVLMDSHLDRSATTSVRDRLQASRNGEVFIHQRFDSDVGVDGVRTVIERELGGQDKGVLYHEEVVYHAERVDYDNARSQILDAGFVLEPAPDGWLILRTT